MKTFSNIILLLSLLGLANNSNSQNFQWAKQMSGTNAETAYDVSIDFAGNIYVTGFFNGTVDFDPGAGTYNLTSIGSGDIFVSKLDASGNFLWARQMGGNNNDAGNSIAIDSVGNIYTTGYFRNTTDFDPGIGIYNLSSAGDADIFISKLDASGNFLWARRFGSLLADESYSLTVEPGGNLYATGWFQGTVDFDPDTGIFNMTSLGNFDIFICKLNSSGNFIWAKQMGGLNSEKGNSIAADLAGSIYLTGDFLNTVDFDPDTGTYNLTSAGGSDIFVSKFDTAGNFIWTKRMGGTAYDYGFSIAIDNSGDVYTAGRFGLTVDFDPDTATYNLTSNGGDDIFISKLDSSGNFVWAKGIGGTGTDLGNSIDIEGNGNVYTTGYFYGTVDFNPDAGIYNMTSVGFSDVFISKLEASGNFLWAGRIGGTSLDISYSIAVNDLGDIHATGYFNSTADFNPDIGIYNMTAAGQYDIFVLKLSDTPTEITENDSFNTLNIFPNPSSGLMHILSSKKIDEIKIIDSFGEIIYQSKLNSNYPFLRIDKSGVYFVLIKVEEVTVTKKLVIIK